MLDLLTVGPECTRPTCRATAAAIGRYLLPLTDLCSKPTDHRYCCHSTGQTDGRTLDCFMMLTAYCAEQVIMALIARDSW